MVTFLSKRPFLIQAEPLSQKVQISPVYSVKKKLALYSYPVSVEYCEKKIISLQQIHVMMMMYPTCHPLATEPSDQTFATNILSIFNFT